MSSDSIRRWWELFNDPVLNQLVADTLINSPDVRTAVSRVAAANAQRGVARSRLFPSVNAGISGQSTRTYLEQTGASVVHDSYRADMNTSWELDLFGRQRLEIAAANATVAQMEENYRAAQVSLSASVGSSYITLRATEAQLKVLQHNIEVQEQTVEIARWSEQVGQTDALETLQAETALKQSRAGEPPLRQTISQTRNQLALLMGETPGSIDARLEPPAPIPRISDSVSIGIPAEALRQRPDIRASEHTITAATALAETAERQRFPTVALTGSIGVEALDAGGLFDPAATIVAAAGSLTAPIFQAGRIRQTIAIQNEGLQQALLAYESTVLTALAEVEDALLAIRMSSERLGILDDAIDDARATLELARLRYLAGESDILNMLNAQRALLALEDQQVITMANNALSHLQLYRALGGGWTRATAAAGIPSTNLE